MAISSISPATLPQGVATNPVVFRFPGTEAAVTDVERSADLVEVSGVGQFLSAAAVFQSNVEILQTGFSASEPAAATVLSGAQALVEAFNGLQASSGSLQTLVGALAGTSFVEQFPPSLSELAVDFSTASSSAISSLQSIGIEVQTSPLPDGTATITTLSVNESALLAAVTADPAGTEAVLAETAQSLAGLASGLQAEVSGAVATQANLTQLAAVAVPAAVAAAVTDLGAAGDAALAGEAVGVATGLLQNLPADTVLNDVRLTDLDLAAAGLDAETVLTENEVVAGGLAAGLVAQSNTTATVEVPETVVELSLTTVLATGNVGNAARLPSTTLAGATVLPVPVATDVTLPAGNVTVVVSPVGEVNVDANAVDSETAAATLALQVRLADPALRAIDNLIDPAYSAIVAAAHLSDFVLPTPVINPKALLGDVPMPVSFAAPTHGVDYYKEVANDALKRVTGQIITKV